MNPNLEKEEKFVFRYHAELKKDGTVHVKAASSLIWERYSCQTHEIDWDDFNDVKSVVELKPTGRYKIRTTSEGNDVIEIESYVQGSVKKSVKKKVRIEKEFHWREFWKGWQRVEFYDGPDETIDIEFSRTIWVPDHRIVRLERYKPTEEIFECK